MIAAWPGIANMLLPVTLPLAVIQLPFGTIPVFFDRSNGAFRSGRCHKKDNPDRIFHRVKKKSR
jgi:hypothetical protein